MSDDKFVPVFRDSLRKPYGIKRVSFKLNLTQRTHAALGTAGIIDRVVSKSVEGSKVAEKGGYGSAFIEFASETMLFFLLQRSFPKEGAIKYVVNMLLGLLGSNPDSILQVCENMDALRSALLDHRNTVLEKMQSSEPSSNDSDAEKVEDDLFSIAINEVNESS